MMVSVVRIAMPGAGNFAEVSIVEGDTVSRLTERACAKFSHWGANASQIDLYLAAAGGDDKPTPSAVDSARHLDETGWSLERAGVFSGAWLAARKNATGASCPAFRLHVTRLAQLHRHHTLTSCHRTGSHRAGHQADGHIRPPSRRPPSRRPPIRRPPIRRPRALPSAPTLSSVSLLDWPCCSLGTPSDALLAHFCCSACGKQSLLCCLRSGKRGGFQSSVGCCSRASGFGWTTGA